MRSGLTRSFFLAALVFLEPALALAFTPTITPSGAQVSWRNGRKLNLAGNPTNTSGLSDYDVFQAVTRGLRRWESASGGGIHFDYWQGSDPVVYEPDSSYNGLSSLYFASNARGDTRLTPNVLGLTQVWYNTDNGEILETDVVLNDRDFRFTTDPRDTSGTGSGSTSFYAGKSNVYIENVITHELGHAFGLSHSGGLQSTMLFMESPEQAHLSCDEGVAVHAIYPTADAGARGNITGTVVSDYGQPIFGAHVEAISRQRGTVLATAMTDRGGNYALRALEPGTYFLLVEPYYAGASALPQYYAAMSPVICGGQTFARTFLVDNSGYTPVPIGVAAGGTTPAPTLTAHCTGGSAAAVSGAASAPVIYSGGSGFGIVDRLAGGGAYPYADKEYTVQSVAGHLEIHAVSYSLYSPIQLTISLLDSYRNPVSAQIVKPVYTGDSGFMDYDSALIVDNLPPGTYTVHVAGAAVQRSSYPAATGTVPVDPTPFLLLTGSVNEAPPALAGSLPENGRCRMQENFASYSSPPGNPPRSSINGSNGQGGCGTIQVRGARLNGDGPGRPGGPSGGAVAGWLLPWAVMALLGRGFSLGARRRKHLVMLARASAGS